MNDRERRALTVSVTRALVKKALDDPVAMGYLSHFEVTPKDLEEKIGEVLGYLERTEEKEEKAVRGG